MVELVVAIVVIGILVAVASLNMNRKIDTARYRTAMTEMKQIANAIAGNPEIFTRGARTDFGYIGDIGSAPDSIGDLIADCHGYPQWDGPYLDVGSVIDYNIDPWNVQYLINDTTVISVGSGDTISRQITPSPDDLFNNSVSGYVHDANGDPPGAIYRDSIKMILSYPDGTGNIVDAISNPDSRGYFNFGNLPIGNHRLAAVYLPDADTVAYPVSISPSGDLKLNIGLPSDLW